MAADSDRQLCFAFTPIITPRGDGSFIVSPGKPVSEVTPKQAAKIIGIAWPSIYKLLDAGALPSRRPLKRKILIKVEDCEAYKKKTSDPEYWERVKDKRRGQLVLPSVLK